MENLKDVAKLRSAAKTLLESCSKNYYARRSRPLPVKPHYVHAVSNPSEEQYQARLDWSASDAKWQQDMEALGREIGNDLKTMTSVLRLLKTAAAVHGKGRRTPAELYNLYKGVARRLGTQAGRVYKKLTTERQFDDDVAQPLYNAKGRTPLLLTAEEERLLNPNRSPSPILTRTSSPERYIDPGLLRQFGTPTQTVSRPETPVNRGTSSSPSSARRHHSAGRAHNDMSRTLGSGLSSRSNSAGPRGRDTSVRPRSTTRSTVGGQNLYHGHERTYGSRTPSASRDDQPRGRPR